MSLTTFLCQLWVYLLTRIFIRPIIVGERVFPLAGKLPVMPYIIVANHMSQLDGALIVSAFTFKDVWRFFAPMGFITHPAYLDRWWKRLFLYPLGMYPAKPVPNPRIKYGLEKSQELIKKGYSMMVFPEGTRTLPGQTRPKKGVVVLATENKMPLLPVHIEWRKFGKGRKKATVKFGNPFCLLPNNDFDDLAQFIMDYIYKL